MCPDTAGKNLLELGVWNFAGVWCLVFGVSLPITRRVPELFANKISATTRYCAVFGHPVKHSASPVMQNAGLAALGLDWRYAAFDVPPPQLAEAIAGAKAMRFLGLNLTVPHKLLALNLVDALDDSARQWGAVNTIRFEAQDGQGRWQPLHFFADVPAVIRAHGFNTDADAIVRSIREDLQLELRGARMLLLGAGGAARAAALKLAHEGVAEMHLINRTPGKAEEMARDIRAQCPAVRVEIGYPRGKVNLVLNATSLGLKPDDSLPLDESAFALHNAAAVYDMIYTRRKPSCSSARRPQAAASPMASACCSTRARRHWRYGVERPPRCR